MTTVTLPQGRKLEYDDPPAGTAWTKGRVGDVEVHVYIRPDSHGGGVFVDYHDGRGTVHAETGEETVWFNNRMWTRTEEQEEMERISLDIQ